MTDESSWIFETTDYEGTPVVLSHTTWHAKAGNDKSGSHPEIRDYLEEVRTTIASPDLVFQSTRDERSRVFYRLRAGQGGLAGKHVVVIIVVPEKVRSRALAADVQHNDATVVAYTSQYIVG